MDDKPKTNPSWAKAMTLKAAKNLVTGLFFLLMVIFFTAWGWPKIRGGFLSGKGFSSSGSISSQANWNFRIKPQKPEKEPLGVYCPAYFPPTIENPPWGCGPGLPNDLQKYLKITNEPPRTKAEPFSPENQSGDGGNGQKFQTSHGVGVSICYAEDAVVFYETPKFPDSPERSVCGTGFPPMPELLNYDEVNGQLIWSELQDSTKKSMISARFQIDSVGNPTEMKILKSTSLSTQKQLEGIWKDLKFKILEKDAGKIQEARVTVVFRPKN